MLKPLMDRYYSFILTEKTMYSAELKNKKMYYLVQVNRKEISCIFKMIMNSIITMHIFLKEKPDIVICTGVLSMIPMCLIAKAFGKKLIYIESFAKVSSATKTGKLLY